MLKDFQRRFKSALLQSDNCPHEIQSLVGAVGRSSDQILQIYRNNSFGVLKRSLEEAYPAVNLLLGEAFDLICREYIQAHASVHSDLERYGDRLAEFIDSHNELQEEFYLGDVARLEWAIHQKQTWDSLTGKIEIKSDFPIFEIWRATMAQEDAIFDDIERAVRVIVERTPDQVKVYEV